MLKGLGSMMGLLGNPGKLQEEMQKLQQSLANVSAEATAGAGYVTARVNGQLRLLSVRISDDALALNDKEMLEDLITAAVNQATDKARALAGEEAAKMAQNMGLPPGLLNNTGLPGLG